MSDHAKPTFIAKCLCGDLSFSSRRAPVVQLCCHCRDCRNATSDDFSVIAFFAVHHVDIVGETGEKQYVSDSGAYTSREFCVNCETFMFDRSNRFESLVGVFANRLMPPTTDPITAHVWTRSKLAHVELPKDAQCFEKGLPT